MKLLQHYVCPRCDHLLVPVHAVDGTTRRVIALTCPEPYCDHVQCLSLEQTSGLEERKTPHSAGLRRAN